MEKAATQRVFRTMLRLAAIGAHPSRQMEPMRGAIDEKSAIYLIDVAKQWRIEGLVVNGLMSVTAWTRQAALQKKILSDITRRSRLHVENNVVIAELFDLFRKAGVHPILLKGQGLCHVYPTPEMRALGDIDIYVKPDEWAAAMGVVESLPIDSDGMVNNGKHLELVYRNKSVELHHRAADLPQYPRLDDEFRRMIAEAIEQSTERFFIDRSGHIGDEGTAICTPGVTMNAFYIFHHLWGHIDVGLPKLRAFPDLMLFLERYGKEIDLEWLEQTLCRYRLMDFWKTVGAWLVEGWGMQSSDFPFYDPGKARAGKGLERNMMLAVRHSLTDTSAMSRMRRRMHNLRHYIRQTPSIFRIFPMRRAMAYSWRILKLGIKNLI